MLGGMIALTREGALAVATLARPPVNAIDETWLGSLEGVFNQLEGAAVLLLRSNQRAFCAGADLELMRSRFDTADGRKRMVSFVREIQRVLERLERLPQVTIAEIGASALGGGLELALACDLRIAADDARLGLPEPRLGLIPGAGGTQRLPRFASKAKAMDLCLTARMMDAAEAERAGIVSRVVANDKLLEEALAVAQRIAAYSLPVVMMIKESVNRAYETTLAEGVLFERRVFHSMFALQDQKEGMAAFVEKRKPSFKHR